VEITIGVQHVTREIVVESDLTVEEATAVVEAAFSGSASLTLHDRRGRKVVIPTDAIGYVEIGSATPRPVGFGTSA